MLNIEIGNVKIHKMKEDMGLVAFAGVTYGGICLGSIALYKNDDGFNVVFPAKKLKNGSLMQVYYPINKETAAAIKGKIVEAYMEKLNATPTA